MAGIYLHIPFCRQACNYCDFHFSTSLRNKEELINAMFSELVLQKNFLQGAVLDTIYLGGGTPSLLSTDTLNIFFDRISELFTIHADAEITLEANPDDLTATYLRTLRHTPVNRLSIGIQSFHEEDLTMMNRAHTAKQALRCVPEAADFGFENMSVDLIYGLPFSGMSGWRKNVEQVQQLPVNHLSCYCLTVESRTMLAKQVQEGSIPPVDEDSAASQYEYLLDITEAAGIPWYEISNFSKPGFESRHNTSYWKGIPYLGIGPSAHSYNGEFRQSNVRSNAAYVQSIAKKVVPAEKEILSPEQQFNETVLTSLRTRQGITLAQLRTKFGAAAVDTLIRQSEKSRERELLVLNETALRLTNKGLLFADAIASEFFIV
jgi:oxygen-independent coproporphyrinogen-3 oxidase